MNRGVREAIILAGGFGTRLQPVVQDVPKPMAPVSGRPFLSYLLDLLLEYGIAHCTLAVGYKYQVIMDYYGDTFRTMELTYSVEEEPLGTGGAIRKALSGVEAREVLVLNGDTYFALNLDAFYRWHRKKKAPVTIALKQMQKYDRYGSVEVDTDGRIRGFTEKEYRESGYINGGVYLLNREYFLEQPLPEAFSFEHDFLERQYSRLPFYGYPGKAFFIDIGIPDDYEKACKHFNPTE